MNTLSFWLTNARKTSLMQSFMPAVLAVVMAFGTEGFNIWLALAAVLGVLAAHLGMNLADDYFDYKVGTSESRKNLVRQGFRARLVKYPYLTDGSASLTDLKHAIIAFLAVAGVLGGGIMLFRGCHIALIAAFALILGIFYSAEPLKLSYRGLGELVIGLIFGPFLMSGVYIAASGRMDSSVLWVSLPVGLLVVNILFTHSFIDKIADKASGKVTLAVLVEKNKYNLLISILLNTLPFAIMVAAVLLDELHPAYLATLLVLPRAAWLIYSLHCFINEKEIDMTKPAWYLGRMENWDKIRESGTDWFMIRWYCARNITSDYCLIIVLVNVLSVLCS